MGSCGDKKTEKYETLFTLHSKFREWIGKKGSPTEHCDTLRAWARVRMPFRMTNTKHFLDAAEVGRGGIVFTARTGSWWRSTSHICRVDNGMIFSALAKWPPPPCGIHDSIHIISASEWNIWANLIIMDVVWKVKSQALSNICRSIKTQRKRNIHLSYAQPIAGSPVNVF